MATIEVGAQGGQVVLVVTADADDSGEACQHRLPLDLDEARDLCNGIGATIKYLVRVARR